MNLSILYRGPLSSCNYGCPYCPFAKHTESKEEHESDRLALEKFLDYIVSNKAHTFSMLFTPWGEALIHRRYQRALATLTKQMHVRRAAIQTNLSADLSWLADCDKQKLGIWATYHPGEVDADRFAARCYELIAQSVRFSVGVVGMKEHFKQIQLMRASLPQEVYMWVNAYKREENYYSSEDEEFLRKIDPLFAWNNQYHSSSGKSCRAGADVISVDGDGVARRCHFIKEPIGNIYEHPLNQILKERACSNQVCGCHIGYVHLDHLGLYEVYGEGVLERIPSAWPNADFFPQPSASRP